jgi:hypothetical protein
MEKPVRTMPGSQDAQQREKDIYFAYSATLRIFGDIRNIGEISATLGIQPTHTHRKGEKGDSQAAAHPHDMWLYSLLLRSLSPWTRTSTLCGPS